MTKGNFNYNMCKSCGGQCCQSYAGSYIPSDFKDEITADFIIGLLKSGKFALDWWEGDATGDDLSKTYYLRPRHKNEEAIKGSWGGQCINWSLDKGCSIKEQDRPHQCRMLKPNYKNGEANCVTSKKDKATKQDCAIAWYPFQNILNQVVMEF